MFFDTIGVGYFVYSGVHKYLQTIPGADDTLQVSSDSSPILIRFRGSKIFFKYIINSIFRRI